MPWAPQSGQAAQETPKEAGGQVISADDEGNDRFLNQTSRKTTAAFEEREKLTPTKRNADLSTSER